MPGLSETQLRTFAEHEGFIHVIHDVAKLALRGISDETDVRVRGNGFYIRRPNEPPEWGKPIAMLIRGIVVTEFACRDYARELLIEELQRFRDLQAAWPGFVLARVIPFQETPDDTGELQYSGTAVDLFQAHPKAYQEESLADRPLLRSAESPTTYNRLLRACGIRTGCLSFSAGGEAIDAERSLRFMFRSDSPLALRNAGPDGEVKNSS